MSAAHWRRLPLPLPMMVPNIQNVHMEDEQAQTACLPRSISPWWKIVVIWPGDEGLRQLPVVVRINRIRAAVRLARG